MEPPAEPQWMIVGTFKGAANPGLVGQLANYLHEYESDDSLFRDFGDLGIGIGGDIGGVDLDLDLNFRHRIVSSHETIPPGETITGDDISLLRRVGTSRSRLRVTWEYIPEIFSEDDGIAIQVEGGYSVSASRAQPPTRHDLEPLEGLILEPASQEYANFKEDYEVSMEKHGVVYVTAGSAAAVVDSLAGYIGNKFADTERAALYWDKYSEPLMLFPKSGLPLKMKVFLGDDPTLAVGDKLTFTSFMAISPLVLGLEKYGARLGFRYFWRFLRETTIKKDKDSIVEVRVRDWRGRGGEFTPFKYRPEVRLWIVTLGYTFFETVRDDFRERTSEAVYRIDLKTENGMAFFKWLVKESGRITTSPQKPDDEDQVGVEVLTTELSRGKNRDFRIRANFFSWFRYRTNKIGTTRRIIMQDAELNEAIRARTKEYYSKFGRTKDVRNRSVIVAQSNVRWQEDLEQEHQPEDEKIAIIFSTNYSNRWAREADIRALAVGIEKILGLQGSHPILEEFKTFETEDRTRLTVYLDVSLGPDQIARTARVPENEYWKALGEILLGPELADAWTTEGKRYYWEPGAPLYRGVDPPVANIGRYYDSLRGFKGRPLRRSRIFNPAEYSSRDLYRIAIKTAKKLENLQELFLENPDCLRCLVKGYSTGKDVYLIQALIVRFSGGIETGGVGYDFNILVGNMVRPVGATNGIDHGYQLPRGGDILRTAEQTWESPPRLRAGQILLNVSGADREPEEGEPCGKLRLFSDHYFADDIGLRIVWRRARKRADRSLKVEFATLGEPQDFTEAEAERGFVDYSIFDSERALASEFSTFDDRALQMGYGSHPFVGIFEQARYFYDIYLPVFNYEPTKKGFTILLRLLNADGFPVSEEQEILMKVPRNYRELVPEGCFQLVPEGVQVSMPPEQGASTVN